MFSFLGVIAQNCQNLISQLSTSQSYQGYQCIYDSSQNFKVSNINKVYITLETFQSLKDIDLVQGDCNQYYLINPISSALLNDVLIDFQGNSGQNIAQVQVSYDSYFYLQNGNYPTESGLLIYQKNGGASYLFIQNITYNSQNSQLQCNNDYYKRTVYQIIDLTPQSSYFTFQTYIHPTSFPNKIANIQIMAYYQCPIGCSQCNHNKECTSCASGYNYNSNYCYMNCNSNQYALVVNNNTTEQQCNQCDNSCLSCFGTSTQCTTCNNGYYPLIVSQSQATFNCYSTCPNNYFLNNNSQCQKCDQSCQNCITNSTNCTSCSTNYFPLYTSSVPSTNFQCALECPSNYYKQIDKCFICDSSCQTCQDNPKNCTACTNGYYPLYSGSLANFKCYQVCPDNYYLNINQCSQCDVSCQKCSISSTSCLSCQNGYYSIYFAQPQTTFQCYLTCPNNYYLFNNYCQQCDNSCQNCIGNSIACTQCTNGYYPLYIGQSPTSFQCYQICPNNYYLNINQCSQCDQSCKTCKDNSKSCTQCSNGFYPLYLSQSATTFQCYQQCPENYYLKNDQCLKCDASCSTCQNDSISCTSCQSGYYPINTQSQASTYQCYKPCPNGYTYKQNTCQICQQNNNQICKNCGNTCRSCQADQINICQDCYESMNLSGNYCSCKNSQDQRNNFYQCSHDSIAVVQAIFSGDSPILTLEFGSILNQVANLQCSQIFDQNTLQLLGNSSCSISQTKIIVQISDNAIIMANYTIGFNNQAQVLQFQGYSVPINTFYVIFVEQNLIAQPSVLVEYNEIENSCNDISFQISSVQNDANRKFLSLQWSLVNTQNFDSTVQQQIYNIIENANNQQSFNLVIDKYIVPPDQTITIQLSYILKVNENNILSFSTLNQKSKQIVIEYIQNKYPPIYRYQNIIVTYSFYTQICDKSGEAVSYEPLDIQIISGALPQLNQNNSGFKEEQIQLNIQPYSIPLSTTLDIQVQANLNSNNSIKSIQSLSITPKLTDLHIKIAGGSDRLVSYKAINALVGEAIDYEIEDQIQPQGIQLSWKCLNVASSDIQCYDYLNQPYIPPQNILNLTIPSGTFNPYQSLKFTLYGQKDSRKSNSTMMLIFTEIDIPPLYVKFDDPNQIYQVNINDNILATLIYDSNVSSNILTYAGAILYNNNVVGVIKFDYFKVKLRIWDYYSQINGNNPIVQVRFTVYNPANIMPSLCIINFNINIPPQNCILNVSPSSGKALQTQFTIQFTGCETKNSPLTFQFFYYNELNDQLLEIQNPQNILRRQIQDQSISPQITTIFPSGNIVIIGQSMDAFLAVKNSTFQLNIIPYQQNDQSLLNLVSQAIQQSSSTSARNAILNLCIIAEELSKNTTLYNLPSMNQAKINLIQAIISYTNQLPNSSFLSTFSNKVIAQLQQTIVAQNQQSSSVLNQVSLILSNQEQLIKNTNNRLMNNNFISKINS